MRVAIAKQIEQDWIAEAKAEREESGLGLERLGEDFPNIGVVTSGSKEPNMGNAATKEHELAVHHKPGVPCSASKCKGFAEYVYSYRYESTRPDRHKRLIRVNRALCLGHAQRIAAKFNLSLPG